MQASAKKAPAWREKMENKEYKRRPRYKGTHPKKYQEKYKEHHPEKYPELIAHVIEKGSNPAGMHISICVNEILEFLQIKAGQTGLDATLGYGGHTSAMLGCLKGSGHLYALDVDRKEMEKTKGRLENQGYKEDILTIKELNFGDILQVKELGPFDFAMADLGVSSMQIDNPERGFSYKIDGPLDLRLNQEKGISAAERLQHITKEELEGLLIENADEPYASEIAEKITRKIRLGEAIRTTGKLRKVIEEALAFVPVNERKEAVKKSCKRSFQALRIDINNEFEVLYQFLETLPEIMAKNGRIAILTFHSGEDRLVKKSFKRLKREGVYKEISEEVIRPLAEECKRNSRARSTKMRWAVKA